MTNPASGQAAGGIETPKSLKAVQYAPFEAFMAKLEDLDVYSHQACHQFPKIEKHVLCGAIRHCLIEITQTAITAFKRKQKSSSLFELDVKLAVLKHLVRKAYRLAYINEHKFSVWSGHILELGRMVGGWLKHENSKEAKG